MDKFINITGLPDHLKPILLMADATRFALKEKSDLIFSKREDLFQKKHLKIIKKSELESSHDRVKGAIAEEIDPVTRKPRFSNEIKRQAEFLERSAGDRQVRELEEHLDVIVLEESRLENQINQLLQDREVLVLDYKLMTSIVSVLTETGG